MIEFYPQIRLAHIASVTASGSLFLLRGVLVTSGRAWGNHAALRYLSYSIDTVLLTAALMLMTVLNVHPGNQPWLAVKLSLLVVYVVLGSFALKRARTPRARLACFIAALAVFLSIVTIARTRDPLGPLAPVLRPA
jgi:uncharacterized membrane protein SirB2